MKWGMGTDGTEGLRKIKKKYKEHEICPLAEGLGLQKTARYALSLLDLMRFRDAGAYGG